MGGKLKWLEQRAIENNGFFKATFKADFINALRLEIADMGALYDEQDRKMATWTAEGKGYDCTARGPKYIGGRGMVTFRVFKLDLSDPIVRNAEAWVNLARAQGASGDQVRGFEQALALAMKNAGIV